MNEQKQREAMARLEGFTDQGCPTVWTKGEEMRWTHQLPTYNSHDDVQRVIDGLEEEETFRYVRHLRGIMGDLIAYCFIIKATPAQKVEAILKAKGLWEE